MRLPSLLLALACAATILSGCVGHASGLTAKDAADSSSGPATSWKSDAMLLGVVGFGHLGNVSAADDPLHRTEGVVAITAVDGTLPGWFVAYVSESAGQVAIFNVTSSGATVLATTAYHGPKVEAKEWSVDSPAALKAARTNASLDAALSSGGRAFVQYGLDAVAGAWQINVAKDGFWGWFTVDAASGQLVKAVVMPNLGLGVPRLPTGPLPAPIHATGTIAASADPLNLQPGGAICTTPTAQCTRIPFTLNASADVTATLAWGTPANDFDLYIYQDGTQVSNDGINQFPPSGPGDVAQTTQVMHASLDAGSYEFVVVPWNAVQDSWTLDATFGGAGAPPS